MYYKFARLSEEVYWKKDDLYEFYGPSLSISIFQPCMTSETFSNTKNTVEMEAKTYFVLWQELSNLGGIF